MCWRVVGICALMAVATSAIVCGQPPASASSPPESKSPADARLVLHAVVSVAPLKGLVEPLLPPGSTVQVLIPPGVSEHGYEVPPDKLAALARADMVVIVGLGIEPQVEKFLASNRATCRQDVVFAREVGLNPGGQAKQPGSADGRQAAKPAEHADHPDDDHDDHDHHHAGADPHLWLDPLLARRMLPAVSAAAEKAIACRNAKEPLTAEQAEAARSLLSSQRQRTEERIDRLHAGNIERLKTARLDTIIVGHDAWGLLADRYGFKTVAIKGLNATEPSPAVMREAVKTITDRKITTVFVEPQISAAAGKRIAQATGATVRTLDPLGDGDWFGLMERNLTAIAAALEADKPG